jgi:hypothetical protein
VDMVSDLSLIVDSVLGGRSQKGYAPASYEAAKKERWPKPPLFFALPNASVEPQPFLRALQR